MWQKLKENIENVRSFTQEQIINDIQNKASNLREFIDNHIGKHITESFKQNLEQDLKATNDVANLKKTYLLIGVAHFLATEMQNKNISSDHVFKGGHVIIEDSGAFYKQFQALLPQRDLLPQKREDWTALVKKRISSHHKGKKTSDLGIGNSNAFPELLIGTTKEGHTYLQFEGSPVNSLKSFLCHIIDFIIYRITGKNIGPYGRSEHTEHKDPIRLVPPLMQLQLKATNASASVGCR